MDVKNDFLHGDLSEDIYMEQPHRVHSKLILSMSTEEVPLWPQAGT
jgi:hypothetical protein